jgi:hypothetical protein
MSVKRNFIGLRRLRHWSLVTGHWSKSLTSDQ